MVEDFRAFPGLDRVILFGSAARGTMTEASDLDIVLVFDLREQAIDALKRLYSARQRSHWPIDILSVDRAHFEKMSRLGGILFVAADEGRTIFERKTS